MQALIMPAHSHEQVHPYSPYMQPHHVRTLPCSNGFPLLPQVVVEEVEVQKELFFTEGEDALVEARKAIAAWSLPRAAARLAAAKQLRQGGLDVLKVN